MANSYQFAIVTNDYQESKDIAHSLKEKLYEAKIKENDFYPNVVFVIGGDGTFLKAVQKYNQQLDTIKFITFKKGNIGFYHTFSITDISEVVRVLSEEEDSLTIHELDLLEVEANNKIIYGINEFRLINSSQVLRCDVYINDELLEVFSGTGIIISTKTGSTGLMKSAGGAVILSDARLMEYQELFPISNNIYHSVRAPLILDHNQIVTLKLKDSPKEKINNSQIIVDTFNFHDKLVNKLVKEVQVKISNKTLKIFAFKSNSNSLIDKLNNSFIKN